MARHPYAPEIARDLLSQDPADGPAYPRLPCRPAAPCPARTPNPCPRCAARRQARTAQGA